MQIAVVGMDEFFVNSIAIDFNFISIMSSHADLEENEYSVFILFFGRINKIHFKMKQKSLSFFIRKTAERVSEK